MNSYVFIVGCPRSGTRLLQRMVNAHPEIAVTSEAPRITECFEGRKGLTPDGTVTADLIPRLLENRRFARLRIGREKMTLALHAPSRVRATKASRMWQESVACWSAILPGSVFWQHVAPLRQALGRVV